MCLLLFFSVFIIISKRAQKKDAIYIKQRPYLHLFNAFSVLLCSLYKICTVVLYKMPSVLLWAHPVLFTELSVKLTGIVISDRLDDIRHRYLAVCEQIDRLLHPLLLEQFLVGLPGLLPDLPAQPVNIAL